MIQIYNSPTINFSKNGRAMHEALSCYVEEELNGAYEAELEYPIDKIGKWKELVNGNLLKIDNQVFRIYNKRKSLDGIMINARHLFYDNLDNFLEDVRPENLSGVAAGQWILARTQYPHLFTVTGNLGGLGTRYFIRKNVVEAFMGENGILNSWGGEIERDNYNIILHAHRGTDRGVHIRYGKNILGIEEALNIDDVCTRMMPIGKDGLLLPEKYIDSPHLGNYPYPKIKTVEFKDAETVEDLRAAAQDLMDDGEIDIPKANYKVDFIELSKTEEYKDYQVLERVYLGDTVTIKHSKLNMDLKARVIKLRRNILTGRIENLELGYFLPNLAASLNGVGSVLINIAEIIASNKTLTQQAIDDVTHLITSALGGYVVKKNGELLIMDTEDPMTATKVWRWNLNGFGYSGTGINGPYELAIGMDGKIVAGSAFFNSIVTNLIQSDIGSSLNLQSNTAIQALVEADASKTAQLNVFADLIENKVTQTQVEAMIDAVNRAKPNLITNLPENWEQGTLNATTGNPEESLYHIRSKAFFPVRQGHVTFKVSPLYEALIIVYNSTYGFKESHGFINEFTFLLSENAYFKVVLKRTNGSGIIPDAIGTAELKVENSDTSTQWTPYYGDLTLEQQQEFYQLEMNSSNGWTVDSDAFTSNLTVRILLFNEDVTMQYQAYQFTWYKQYPNGAKISLGNGTSKTITGIDLEKSATITCEFEIVDTIYLLATYNGDTLLTFNNDTLMIIGDYQ